VVDFSFIIDKISFKCKKLNKQEFRVFSFEFGGQGDWIPFFNGMEEKEPPRPDILPDSLRSYGAGRRPRGNRKIEKSPLVPLTSKGERSSLLQNDTKRESLYKAILKTRIDTMFG
jgi:hypothetical protein